MQSNQQSSQNVTHFPFTYTSFGNIGLTTYPTKEDYGDDTDKWLKAMTMYFLYKSENIMRKRFDMNERSKRLYNAITDSSKVPSYAVGANNISPSDVTYEHLNALYNPINVRIGEIASKGFNLNVYVANEEARSRKEQVRAKLYLDKFVAEKFPELIEDEERQQIMQTINIEKTMKGYRDVYELAMERAMTDWMERNHFEDWYRQMGLMYLLTNTAHGCPSIDPDTFEVSLPLIDPNTFVFDVDCEDDYFKEKRYYIYFNYQSLGATLEAYPHLDKDEIIKKANSRGGVNNVLGFPFFKMDDEHRIDQVLVVKAYFIYNDEWEREKSETKGYSVEIEEKDGAKPVIKESVEKETTTEKYKHENVYYCELLGGDFVVKGGVYPYQQRSIRTPAKANLVSQTLCLNYHLDPYSPPVPVRVEALQAYRNFYFYKVIHLTSTMKGAITTINPRYIWGAGDTELEKIKNFVENIQNTNIIFRDDSNIDLSSMEQGKSMPAIEVTMVDMPQGVSMLLEHINFLNMLIQETMSFNPSRSGSISKYENQGNAMLNKTQSDYGTANIDISLDRFCENTLAEVANLLKMSFYLKKKYSTPEQMDALRISIGDEFYHLIDDDFKFLCQDIGISFKRKNASDSDRMNEIKALMQVGLQQGQTDIYDMLEIMKFDDPDEGIEHVQKNIKERKLREEAMAMQQQQMQSQQAMAMQQQQGQQQQAQQAQQIDANQIKQAADMQQQKNQNQHDLLKETIGRAYEKPIEPVRTKGAQ